MQSGHMGKARLVNARRSRLTATALVLALGCLLVGRAVYRSVVIEGNTAGETISVVAISVGSFAVVWLLIFLLYKGSGSHLSRRDAGKPASEAELSSAASGQGPDPSLGHEGVHDAQQ